MSPGQIYLALAIVTEVIATSALRATDGFTRFWPSVLTLAGYAISIYLLALTVRTMPVGIVYAVWSGSGIVLIAAIAWLYFRQEIDAPGLIGIGLILAGVLVVNLFSKSVGH
jgi:small multidrug resistance pump